MNILFLTLFDFSSINEKGIYTDLLREFIKEKHNVYIISPTERRNRQQTHLKIIDNCKILKLQIGNIQKTNLIEKGITTITLESKFTKAIKKYFSDVKFNLVLYSTPPITIQKPVEYVKKRDNAATYLLLKDIFPQNAVDLNMFTKKGLIYKFFRNKEKKIYKLSDKIGCMSQANVEYVLRHNPCLDKKKVEICPNSIEVRKFNINQEERTTVLNKYGIPQDKLVFIYGGNFGKPQGVDFLIKCLRSQRENEKAFFLIVGSGTEYWKLEKYVIEDKPTNVKLMKLIPRDEYDRVVSCCDIGMIFLDHRFTIPNFPSRLLTYMQNSMPVIACTDVNTDIRTVIEQGNFGWWCESNNVKQFESVVDSILNANVLATGEKGYEYLQKNYLVEQSYNTIIKHF
jgi:glycosyltransferase involved in cell wall biosynthesis